MKNPKTVIPPVLRSSQSEGGQAGEESIETAIPVFL